VLGAAKDGVSALGLQTRAERRPTGELLAELVDEGSFVPVRSEVRSPHHADGPAGDGVVCGVGRIDGRTVYCYAQDPSVLGGSLGETHADSICRTLDLAARFGAPVVGIHGSGGARIQEGVRSLAGYARIFQRHVRMRATVPQLALVFGPCAGGAAYGPALMDFVLMPEQGAYLFLTGPEVVREVTGENVGFDDLGGSEVAGRSGLASLVGRDETHTLHHTRTLLRYLPHAVGDRAPRDAGWQEPSGEPGEIVPSDPRATYDVRDVVTRTVDAGSFLELRASSAPNLVCGLARLEGEVVGVVANQPQALAGAIDIQASQKGAWFVGLCDRFRFPLIVLVDTPGFLPGTSQELGGVIPAGASFLSSFVEASVPKVTIVLRKAYGGAFIVMNALDLGADTALAWPGAEIAVLGARGAVKILERRRLAASDDPDALRDELEEAYRREYCTPWPAARAGAIDEVIEPGTTRRRLVAAFA
jgi:acetyl-CoA carboxylase carboxyltransferase component